MCACMLKTIWWINSSTLLIKERFYFANIDIFVCVNIQRTLTALVNRAEVQINNIDFRCGYWTIVCWKGHQIEIRKVSSKVIWLRCWYSKWFESIYKPLMWFYSNNSVILRSWYLLQFKKVCVATGFCAIWRFSVILSPYGFLSPIHLSCS